MQFALIDNMRVFRGTETSIESHDIRNDVYCLFPNRIGTDGILAVISRKAFTEAVIDGRFRGNIFRPIYFSNELAIGVGISGEKGGSNSARFPT